MPKVFNNDIFTKNIQTILEQFTYDMYLIRADQSMTCTCTDPATKSPELLCEKCLGVGYRIRIQKVQGANRENKTSYRTYGVSENASTNIFYFNEEYPIKEKDLIMDTDKLYIVQRFGPETGADNQVIYYRAEANPVKAYAIERLANFYKIIGG